MNPNLEMGGVFIASLVGSWHCAGMCGPFSAFMSMRQDVRTTQAFYHLGRLITYSTLTVILFLLALPVKALVGPWFLFAVLIFWLVAGFFGKSLLIWQIPKPIIKLNQKMSGYASPLFGLSLGLVTTLLPCVWLYGFVGLAITKPNLHQALLFIFIFWLGTIPALLVTQNLFLKSNNMLKKYSRKFSLVLMIILSVFSLWIHKPQTNAEENCPIHHSGH